MSRHSDPHVPPARPNTDAAMAANGEEEAIEALCRDFADTLHEQPYYSSGRTWKDYAPAYRYAFRSFRAHGERAFEEIERELKQEWNLVRDDSRLTWPEARQAMIAAWRHARLRSGPAAPARRAAGRLG